MQSIDYTYNIRGWLTKINDPANLNGKLFGYKIKYNEVEGLEIPNTDFSTLKVKAKYNGNIAEVDWRTGTVTGDNLRRYGYVYDNLNRLSAGFYQKDTNPSAKEYFEKMDYDLNGNITNLKRSAESQQGASAFNIDDLAYVYTGNRMTSVTDSSTDYRGYPDTSGNEIPYDVNGNMISHVDKGILQIDYNFLNLPNYVKFDKYINKRGFKTYVNTGYIYRADGVKISKSHNYIGWVNSVTQMMMNITTDYLDGFQYETAQSVTSLKFVPTAEGYYNFENNKYIYNYTDHLGNVRLSYFNNGSGAEVLEENNYYPFGMKHEGYNALAGNPAYKYSYNGKELQTESGMYDYGARMYMSDIGRWGVVDPLAEKSRRFTPYNYAINNPIRFIDPDGRSESDWIRKDGKWQYDSKVTTVEQAKEMGDVDGFAKNGTVLANVSVDGGAESAYAQLNEGGSITKLAADDLASMNAIVDMLPMSLGGSWTTWTHETFPILTGGAGETDPETMKKTIHGDNIETNDMFKIIFSFYGRNTKLSGGTIGFQEALVQFGLDAESIGNPFGNPSKKPSDTIVPLSVPLDGKDSVINVKIPKASEKAMYYDPRNGSFYNQNFNPSMIEKRDSIMKSKKIK